MSAKIHVGYVWAQGEVYLQLPADNQWGFVIADDDQTWDFPPFGEWEAIDDDDPRITPERREMLQWILDEAEREE